MKHCHFCHSELADEAKYCEACGRIYEEQASAPTGAKADSVTVPAAIDVTTRERLVRPQAPGAVWDEAETDEVEYKNRIVWSIISVVISGLSVFAILAVVYAFMAQFSFDRGDYMDAVLQSGKAKTWSIRAIVISAILAAVYFLGREYMGF